MDPPSPQVVWFVDGAPFVVAECPYAVRRPLAAGEHTFQVRVPFTSVASSVSRVTVE